MPEQQGMASMAAPAPPKGTGKRTTIGDKLPVGEETPEKFSSFMRPSTKTLLTEKAKEYKRRYPNQPKPTIVELLEFAVNSSIREGDTFADDFASWRNGSN